MTTRRYTPPDPDGIVTMSRGVAHLDHLRAHLDLIGCTCDQVELLIEPLPNGTSYVSVAHDEGCPVLARRERGAN
jgi:hypothetical protein